MANAEASRYGAMGLGASLLIMGIEDWAKYRILNKACGMGGSPAIYAGKSSLKNGFTLIELSIVLVIIGLIVGGVLVGQDLIAAAAIRAQISQMEQYQAAVNTFRAKYDALPGDMDKASARAYGFVSRGGGIANGNGDGVLSGANYPGCWSCGASDLGAFTTGEPMFFWEDLSSAQ